MPLPRIRGTRREVWDRVGSVIKTRFGGLKRTDLRKNKQGRIVSKKVSDRWKKMAWTKSTKKARGLMIASGKLQAGSFQPLGGKSDSGVELLGKTASVYKSSSSMSQTAHTLSSCQKASPCGECSKLVLESAAESTTLGTESSISMRRRRTWFCPWRAMGSECRFVSIVVQTYWGPARWYWLASCALPASTRPSVDHG